MVDQGVYLRTLLKKELYDDLVILAKSLQTGRGHWDFGVAIEYLINNVKNDERFSIIEARIDELENHIMKQQIQNNKKENDEELLGSYHLKNKGE